MKKNLLAFCQRHIYTFWLLLRILCTLLGVFLGIGISISEDAPGAVLIFGGISLVGSGLVCGIGVALTQTLKELKEGMKK
jgi:hypothetical protein